MSGKSVRIMDSGERKTVARKLFQGTRNMKDMARTLFQQIDVDKKGFLTQGELERALKEMDSDGFTEELLDEVFTKIQYDFDDFWMGFSYLLRAKRNRSALGPVTGTRTAPTSPAAPTPLPSADETSQARANRPKSVQLDEAEVSSSDDDDDDEEIVVQSKSGSIEDAPKGALRTGRVKPKGISFEIPSDVKTKRKSTKRVHHQLQARSGRGHSSQKSLPVLAVERPSGMSRRDHASLAKRRMSLKENPQAMRIYDTLKQGTEVDMAGQLFQVLDANGDGVLSREEVHDALRDMDPDNFSEERTAYIFSKLDKQGRGFIDIDAFRDGFHMFVDGGGEDESEYAPAVVEAFNEFESGQGHIAPERLGEAMGKIIGRVPTQAELSSAFDYLSRERITEVRIGVFSSLLDRLAKELKAKEEAELGAAIQEWENMSQPNLIELLLQTKNEVDVARAQARRMEQRFQSVAKAHDRVNVENSELQASFNGLEEELRYARLEAEEYKEQWLNFKEMYQKSQAQLMNAERLKAQAETELADAEAQLENIDRAYEITVKQKNDLEMELENLQQSHSNSRRNARAAGMLKGGVMASKNIQIKKLQDQLAQLQGIDEEVKVYQDEISKLHHEQEENQRLIESLMDTLSTLRASMQHMDLNSSSAGPENTRIVVLHNDDEEQDMAEVETEDETETMNIVLPHAEVAELVATGRVDRSSSILEQALEEEEEEDADSSQKAPTLAKRSSTSLGDELKLIAEDSDNDEVSQSEVDVNVVEDQLLSPDSASLKKKLNQVQREKEQAARAAAREQEAREEAERKLLAAQEEADKKLQEAKREAELKLEEADKAAQGRLSEALDEAQQRAQEERERKEKEAADRDADEKERSAEDEAEAERKLRERVEEDEQLMNIAAARKMRHQRSKSRALVDKGRQRADILKNNTKTLKAELFQLSRQVYRNMKMKNLEQQVVAPNSKMTGEELQVVRELHDKLKSEVALAAGDEANPSEEEASTQMKLMLSEMRRDMIKKQRDWEARLKKEEELRAKEVDKHKRHSAQWHSQKTEYDSKLSEVNAERERLERIRKALAVQLATERTKNDCNVVCNIM